MKEREYLLLREISKDETVTQSGLASQLSIAIGSVNWYIKRLINRGYLKATRMDRTRLKYNLTPEGMAVFSRRAKSYAIDSLNAYRNLRKAAKDIVFEMKDLGIKKIHIHGADDVMDIVRLTCLEYGIETINDQEGWIIKFLNNNYELVESSNKK